MKLSARRLGALAAFGLLSTLPRAAYATEPCKLMTVQEVAQVLGGTVSSSPLGTTGCFWAGGTQKVSIVVRDASAWARITIPVQGMTKTNISGLGDAASISGLDQTVHPGQSNVLTLSVKQGASVIVLTVYGVDDPARQRSMEESLARLALPRL